MNTPRLLSSLPVVVLVTGVAVTAGCASGSSGGTAYFGEGAFSHSVLLRVQNNNWQDVRIYLVRESGGSPVRIGTVSSMRTAVIRIRNPLMGSARLLLRPIGTTATYTTNGVMVQPGQTMELMVGPSLTTSQLVLR